MKSIISICITLFFTFVCACERVEENYLSENVEYAAAQYDLLIEKLGKNGKPWAPRTVDTKGNIVYAHNVWDWTSGFFAGSLWYLYNLTGDEKWKTLAKKYTETLKQQYITSHHDVGFIIGCSYLNGMRMGQEAYDTIIVQAAKSLSTRFRPGAGVIQSWNTRTGWQAQRGWECPVIIDNMMNLEILFEATSLSGDSTFYNMAVSHADMTLKNHFRMDGSSYHVVDYDMRTGKVRSRCTAQGYSDESAWARGQAWGIYGYTMCYRYTRQLKYLEQAEAAYEFVCTHPNLPEDLIPYWDFDAVNIPHELRDASVAAIMAAALYELSMYSNKAEYKETADKVMHSLSSSDYRSKIGENHNFLLMHSVGSYPHGSEIDVPLIYADYYFLEALKRKRDCDIEAKSKSVQK
ncbi:glycoside hydrolase family 88 protein [Bacteroides sp. AF32-8BH]|uniref:glycoside hydrolase family 88 protein n=1 Tax=Bacteroides sp. AF32-8BH TaxID=2302925 RepID=UPI000E416554|nr:glycoside hydrolase family 88 protein [Bacteroides sp. AF32-8BH]RGE74263.1 glucuronyl hydrolase [Bacteroides sp. AF32-8BH]